MLASSLQVTTLPNGLRVATESTPFAETATVGVWIDAGSRYETAATNGTAHFLEHMAFKGTKVRGVSATAALGVRACDTPSRRSANQPYWPAPERAPLPFTHAQRRTQQALEQEVEDLGAHLNAYTSREQTTYYAKVFSKDVGRGVDILADILQNSALAPEAVERERSVILREMEEVEKEAEEVLFDHLHATAYQFTALGRPILGPADNVRRISRDDLAAYIATHYTAPRMVVVGAGGVDHSQLVSLAAAAFTNLPSGPSTTAQQLCASSPAVFTGSEVRMRDDDAKSIHLALAVQGAPWREADSVALMVMQSLLGSWDKGSAAGVNSSSPLAAGLATNGLVESYTAFNSNYHDTGLFGIHAVIGDPSHADDAAWLLMKHFALMAYDVNPEDVLRAAEQLKSSLLLHGEGGSSAIAEDVGRQLLTYGRRVSRAEMFARIDAVTPDAIKAVARKYITDADVAVAAMGPTQFLPDYNWFQRKTYMLRY